ncbi:MAG: arsenosugar biosynthesis radical SAM protein ArsS [Dehalococcoidales bacterium]|nr:MAG: arsenosugar biosynthesis radical SAM protein ArsS [Dehalococcoidales bacterium]
MNSKFERILANTNLMVNPVAIQTLWVNITKRCNQFCTHCHVEASPSQTEQMSRETLEQCLRVLSESPDCGELDITGGAPELHPDFDYLILEARKMGKQITVRHNLTVTVDGDPNSSVSKQYLPDFFAENKIRILASLPHYNKKITDQTRGEGVFQKSIQSIRHLNSLGYGRPDSGLVLNLVHNCEGPISVDEKTHLEITFKKKLFTQYGLVFNSLLAVINMPVGRFRSLLKKQYRLEEYTRELENKYNPESIKGLVCRYLISVGYDGSLYDCDFNQVLGIKVSGNSTGINNYNSSALLTRKIRFGNHCFGCTAGGGSR